MKAVESSSIAGLQVLTYATGGSGAITRSIADSPHHPYSCAHDRTINQIVRTPADAQRDRSRADAGELAESSACRREVRKVLKIAKSRFLGDAHW